MGKIEVTHELDLLSAMFEKGHAYSTINSAKGTITNIVHILPTTHWINIYWQINIWPAYTETYNPTAAAVTIKLLSINMVLNDLSVTFVPTEVLKHSGKGKPLDKCEYKTLCVIVCLKE